MARWSVSGGGHPHRPSQPVFCEATDDSLGESYISLEGGEVDVGRYVVGPVVAAWLALVGAAAEGDGLGAGCPGLQSVGTVVGAEVGVEPAVMFAGDALDEGEGAGRVVAHLQEALALQRQQVGGAERLQAEEEGGLARQVVEVALAEGLHPLAEGLLRAGGEE